LFAGDHQQEKEEQMDQDAERVAELRDLYRFATALNEIGFNLSTESLEQEATKLGVDLVSEQEDTRR
jgi:hypothetical protein